MTPTEKAIRDFCGRHADWWPSTTQVQEMLALAQPCPTCEALARTVMLDQTSHDTTPPQRKPLTEWQITEIYTKWESTKGTSWADLIRAIEAAHGIKE
jgi:bacterioferritin-associated ferredoxin